MVRQRDVKAAVAAAVQAGLAVRQVKLDADGAVVVVVGDDVPPASATTAAKEAAEWDELIRKATGDIPK